jgi:plasmid stabilization system protein ParE
MTCNSFSFISDAKNDILQSYLWYEKQATGLGIEFSECIEEALSKLSKQPLNYPIVHDTYRRILIHRFPYAIFFEYIKHKHQCVIYSVFHCSQSPKKWIGRLK